jgi:hypothetical protein
MLDFYDPGPLKHVAINLFYGWGYNFYRKENQLRADDQLIRTKAAWLLGSAHLSVETAEHAFRREKLPPPSRANPYPDPADVADVQSLERLASSLSGLIGRLHAQPSPENDRMTQRYRHEAETLVSLGACDEQLIGQAELLRGAVDGKDGAWLLGALGELETGVKAIEETMRQRQAMLM